MPFRIKMYTMDSIVLEKSLGKGAYGEVFKGTVEPSIFGEVIKDVALKQLLIKNVVQTKSILASFVKKLEPLLALVSMKTS